MARKNSGTFASSLNTGATTDKSCLLSDHTHSMRHARARNMPVSCQGRLLGRGISRKGPKKRLPQAFLDENRRLERVTLAGAEAAGRLAINRSDRVGAGGRAAGLVTDVFVRTIKVGRSRSIGIRFLLLQRPGSLGAVDLFEV